MALRMLVAGLAYHLVARVCSDLLMTGGPVSPVWAPSGIALAAVLVWGAWMLPALLIADVAASIVLGLDAPIAVGIGVGDMAEAVVAATIIRRWAPAIGFCCVSDVAVLLGAAASASVLSATCGVFLLQAAGELAAAAEPQTWLRYWMSTSTGMLLFTPFLLVWRQWRRSPPLGTVCEAAALAAVAAGISWAVFLPGSWGVLPLLLLLPAFSWAILRFGRHGATGTTVLVASMITWRAASVDPGVARASAVGVADFLQVMLAMASVANLTVATTIAEGDRLALELRDELFARDQAQMLAAAGSWRVETDRPDRVIVSSGLRRILGIDPEPYAEGVADLDQLRSFVHAADRPRFDQAVGATVDGRGPAEVECRILRPGGSERVTSHVMHSLPGPRGDDEDLHLIGVVHDVTEDRVLEQFKDALIATASHELRTPLTAIIGFAETLLGRWERFDDPQRRQFVEVIAEQAHRLDHIVEDTLLQSRVDAGTVTSEHAPVRVGPVIRSALSSLGRGRDVEVRCLPATTVHGDALHLERIIVNLVSNAFAYGLPPVVVSAEARPEEGVVSLRVEDAGEGVPAAFVPRMFERFTRGPDTSTDPGTGLGLSIVHGLVEALHGTIRYEHDDGASTFVVDLPLHVPGPRSVARTSELDQGAGLGFSP